MTAKVFLVLALFCHLFKGSGIQAEKQVAKGSFLPHALWQERKREKE